MVLIIDNNNESTHNIVHAIKKYSRHDVFLAQEESIDLEQVKALEPEVLIFASLSFPKMRDEGKNILARLKEVVDYYAHKKLLLGIDSGFLFLAYCFGAKIKAVEKIEQALVKEIKLDGRGLFRSIGNKANFVLYNCFYIEKESLSKDFEITAKTNEAQIMGFRHKTMPIEAVLFHPESYASEYEKQFFVSVLNYRREALPVQEIVTRLCAGEDLDRLSAEIFMEDLTDGCLDERQTAAILTALTAKGPSEEEIAGCAAVLYRKKAPLEIGTRELTDIVGTGGDSKGSFNISSMAALLASSCDLAIAKHGNRAVSSKSGSADFYEALGIKIDTSAEDTARAIKKTHFGFLFAPLYHAAMKHAAPVRRAIGIKTIMNLIGPLSNPAGAAYQMLGVYDLSLLAPVARASKLLGAKRVMVVCSLDGFDEISPCEKTAVFEIDEDGNEKNYFLDPKDFEIENCDAKELDGGTAEENALLAFDLMEGRGLKAIVEAVSLNAGAALYIGKKAGSIEEGYKMAKEAIISRRLKEKVKEIQEETNAKESA